jgi:cytochrome c peroxidase
MKSAAAARAVALTAAVIVAAISPWPRVIGPFDKSFPAQPTATDLVALRRAYLGAPASWPRPRLLPGAQFTEMAPLELHAPAEGKARELARLGAELFEDPLLSESGHFSCQSCHNRRLGWGDGLPTSFGHGRAKGKRNAPSLFTAGYKSSFFWDGRSASLEEQALGPLADDREMANDDFTGLLQRINAIDKYRMSFAAITGHETVALDTITSALAAFERTLERPTRFDRFMQGDAKALSNTEVWGLHLFRTKAGCANCHSGATLSDGRFHNLGLSFFNRELEDLGRYGITGKPSDTGRFLTPSLRHVSRTGPYMHNGIFPNLAGLIRFYEAGGGRVRAEQDVPAERKPLLEAAVKKSTELEAFTLTPAERVALLAYVNAL